MTDYKIIDDFLPKNDLVALQNILLKNDFSWYYLDTVAQMRDPDKSHYYFVNCLYDKSVPISQVFYDFIQPIHSAMQKHDIFLKALLRLKANMYPSTKKIVQHDFHTDMPFEHKGLILSINTCNGATILEDGTKIDSVANRLLMFDSSKPHASTTCTDQNVRVNINMNYL
jgi:hypothetical protein